MTGSIECYLTCSLILMTFAFTMCQSQRRPCTLTASPHPEGLCGERLAQAHSNLCFLLALAYPDVFGKRSSLPSSPASLESLPSTYFSKVDHVNAPGQGHSRVRREVNDELLERIYSIPLSVLAQMNINEDNWRSFVLKRDLETNFDQREETGEFQYTDKDLEELPAGPTRQMIRMLSKRSVRHIQKRSEGLACECCINSCLPRQMATYC